MQPSQFKGHYLFTLLLISVLSGCMMIPKGDTPEQQRESILQMEQQTLNRLYEQHPDAQEQIQNAAGYGVFSSIGTSIIIANFGNGYGVIHDNTKDTNRFMRMERYGGGLGVGQREYKMVMVFHNEDILNDIQYGGWTFGAGGSATFKEKDKDGTAGSGNEVLADITIYEMADSGFMLTGNVSGMTFRKAVLLNDDNSPPPPAPASPDNET